MTSILILATPRRRDALQAPGCRLAPTSPRSAPQFQRLASGGTASGPVSFMKGFDAFAGVIKSAGADTPCCEDGHPQRRPPRHSPLHPMQGVRRKGKAWALIEAGYRRCLHRRGLRLSLLPELEQLHPGHRRVHASLLEDKEWRTYAVTDKNRVVGTYQTRDLMRQIADAAGPAAIPGCSSTPPLTSGTPARIRAGSTPVTPARSSSSSTTPPATSPAST